MTDRDVRAEEEANEQRDAHRGDDGGTSIIDVVENAVSGFAKPLSQDRPSEDDVEERREENDREQR